MEKLTQFIKKFVESEGFKLLLEKVKSVLNVIQLKVNNIPVLNKILEKLTILITQHKIAAAVITSAIVLSPSFFGGVEYPKVCRNIVVDTNYSARNDHSGVHRLVLEEERPKRPRKYDSDDVIVFFKAKYNRIANSEGKERADYFVKQFEQECVKHLKIWGE